MGNSKVSVRLALEQQKKIIDSCLPRKPWIIKSYTVQRGYLGFLAECESTEICVFRENDKVCIDIFDGDRNVYSLTIRGIVKRTWLIDFCNWLTNIIAETKP